MGSSGCGRSTTSARPSCAERSTGARRTGGKTGEALVLDLESRLDATVVRARFGRTIYQARKFVTPGHVLVNGHRVDRTPAREELPVLCEGQLVVEYYSI